MADVTTISINDGQATPVSHDFTPVRVESNLVTYSDKSVSTLLGRPRITLGNRLPNGKNGNYKATARVVVPVLETVTAAADGLTPGPTLAYQLLANVEVVIPSRAESAERDDLVAYMSNLIQHTVADALFTDMDLPY